MTLVEFLILLLIAGALLVVVGLMGAVGIGLSGVAIPAAQWMGAAPQRLKEAEYKLRAIRDTVDQINEASAQVERITETAERPAPVKVEVKRPSLTGALLNTTGGLLAGMVVTVALLLLLLAVGDGFLDAIVELIPSHRQKRNIRHLCLRIERVVSRYLLTFTAINIGLGAVIGGGLWLMGMPNPVLWGAMAACLNYIPFLGCALGSGIVFLVAVISFDSVGYALLAPGIYLGANAVEANVITPSLLGKSMRLNVIMVFLSIVLWAWMWGIGGALVAVPLLGAMKITCDHFGPLKPLAGLLGAPNRRRETARKVKQEAPRKTRNEIGVGANREAHAGEAVA